MNKQTNEDDAIWGTMTLALPQVTEWNIEGTGISESWTDLRAFLSELNARGNGKPVTLSINLLMSLGNGRVKFCTDMKLNTSSQKLRFVVTFVRSMVTNVRNLRMFSFGKNNR